MTTIITFNKSHGPYNKNDSAGFEPHVADALVKAGYAVYHAPPNALADATKTVNNKTNTKRLNVVRK
jgi:hypothetical protein